MGDLKIYAATKQQLIKILKIIEIIKLQFRINKCKRLHMEKWKRQEETTDRKLNNETIDSTTKDEEYKCLYKIILYNRPDATLQQKT